MASVRYSPRVLSCPAASAARRLRGDRLAHQRRPGCDAGRCAGAAPAAAADWRVQRQRIAHGAACRYGRSPRRGTDRSSADPTPSTGATNSNSRRASLIIRPPRDRRRARRDPVIWRAHRAASASARFRRAQSPARAESRPVQPMRLAGGRPHLVAIRSANMHASTIGRWLVAVRQSPRLERPDDARWQHLRQFLPGEIGRADEPRGFAAALRAVPVVPSEPAPRAPVQADRAENLLDHARRRSFGQIAAMAPIALASPASIAKPSLAAKRTARIILTGSSRIRTSGSPMRPDQPRFKIGNAPV